MIPFYLGKLFRQTGASDDVCLRLEIGEDRAMSISQIVQKYGNLSGFVERFSLGVRNPTAFLAGAMGVSPDCFFTGVCCGGLITLSVQYLRGVSISGHRVSRIYAVPLSVAPSIRAGNNGNFQNMGEPCIARSVSVHGCSYLICQSSGTYSRDEKVGDAKDVAANVFRAVSRRDMATQMSHVGSAHSSPRRSSFSVSTPSILPIVEVQSFNSSKPEVRDVQVDERVTVTRWSKMVQETQISNFW